MTIFSSILWQEAFHYNTHSAQKSRGKNCKSLFQKKKNIPSKKVEFDKNCTFFSILEHYATMISDSP